MEGTSDTPDGLSRGLSCQCPKCGRGALFKAGFLNFDLRERCENCGLDFSKNDSADGPAVFLIFVLGALMVPLALLMEAVFHPPLWVHGVVWTAVALGLTLGSLKPLKSCVIFLQYKHRPGDWEE